MTPEYVDCPAEGCGRKLAIRYAACSDAMAGRTSNHNKPDGTTCQRGYFTWSHGSGADSGGWFLGFWYPR